MYFGLISILWLMAISHVSALDPAIIGGLPKSSFSATTVSPHQECGNYPIFSQSGAWCLNMNAAAPGDYVQVDLGDVFEVSAVSTKGRSDHPQWITKYKLLYSVESGGPFTEYGEFTGNTDQDTEVINALSPSIKAQYLRFLPTAYSGHKSIRVEAYGTEFLDSCATFDIDHYLDLCSVSFAEAFSGVDDRIDRLVSNVAALWNADPSAAAASVYNYGNPMMADKNVWFNENRDMLIQLSLFLNMLIITIGSCMCCWFVARGDQHKYRYQKVKYNTEEENMLT